MLIMFHIATTIVVGTLKVRLISLKATTDTRSTKNTVQ